MSAILTEKEFSQHLNTKFRVDIDAPQTIELELVEVKGYRKKDEPGEQGGMERFSIFFQGPAEFFLPQRTYSLTHEKLGQTDIFLVPIGRDHYEAVFNYRKE